MCGAKKGGLDLKGVDIDKEAVIQGQVLRGDEPVGGAYVRLLDATGEFTAEVPTSATGHFRFFAAPGSWTLRTLAPKAEPVDRQVSRSTARSRRWPSPSDLSFVTDGAATTRRWPTLKEAPKGPDLARSGPSACRESTA